MTIEIETSTDSVEEVKTALGSTIEIKESQQTEEEPAAEGTEEEGTEAAETEEETTEETEEAETEETKPRKAAPKTVPLSRLSQEVNRRKALERRVEELENRKPASTAVEVAENKAPVTYCGRQKPAIDDFTSKPDKYPDPYAAHADAVGLWYADERDAKRDAETRAAEAAAEREERTAAFRERMPAAKELYPDYDDVCSGSTVPISFVMQDFAYASDIGPDLFYHLAANPDDAEEIMAIKTNRGQVKAMEELETSLKAELSDAKPASKTVKPVVVPPKKQVSKAPPPVARLKPAGTGPKTIQELAGPEDRVGIDIDFNPEYEKAVKAKRGT